MLELVWDAEGRPLFRVECAECGRLIAGPADKEPTILCLCWNCSIQGQEATNASNLEVRGRAE